MCSLPKRTVDKWRVVLKGENPDYIHASSIHVRKHCFMLQEVGAMLCLQGYKKRRAFIITQGPMRSTARDFWKMVYSRKCSVVVMLSDLIELDDVANTHITLTNILDCLCHWHTMCGKHIVVRTPPLIYPVLVVLGFIARVTLRLACSIVAIT